MKDIAMKDLRMIFMALDSSYYDREFKKVNADIRRMKKGDGRSFKLGQRRLNEIGKHLELDKICIAVSEAMILKAFIERPKARPTFRKSIAFDAWQERLIYSRNGAPNMAIA